METMPEVVIVHLQSKSFGVTGNKILARLQTRCVFSGRSQQQRVVTRASVCVNRIFAISLSEKRISWLIKTNWTLIFLIDKKFSGCEILLGFALDLPENATTSPI